MSQEKATFIKVAPAGIEQAYPTEPSKRVAASEIRIERAVAADAEKISECLYLAFGESWFGRREPLHLRPPEQQTRHKRMAKRISPTFSLPNMHWIKAVHVPSSSLVGVAGWAGPGLPTRNIFRKETGEFYGWPAQYGWSDEEWEEVWAGTDLEQWDGSFRKDDEKRREILGDEPHWYLAPLATWPGWQGRGIGSLLLDWAIKQADATDPPTAMYLESSAMARPVYMHVGFYPVEEYTFLRRGPRVVKGLEAEQESEVEGDKKAEVNVEEVQKEAE